MGEQDAGLRLSLGGTVRRDRVVMERGLRHTDGRRATRGIGSGAGGSGSVLPEGRFFAFLGWPLFFIEKLFIYLHFGNVMFRVPPPRSYRINVKFRKVL